MRTAGFRLPSTTIARLIIRRIRPFSIASVSYTHLQSANRMTTGEAANVLGISEATVRRIFSDLEKSGKVVRNYGGIQLAENTPSYSFEQREKIFQQEKIEIGRLAAAAVMDEDTIYLDCGTTIFQMALALSVRIAKNEFSSLRIITNSIANTQAIVPSPSCKVYLIGGEYNDCLLYTSRCV